jgi:hypothetical protein
MGTPVSSTNKTSHRDITEILLKVALNIITSSPLIYCTICYIQYMLNYIAIDRICGVMVSVFASSVVHHGMETRSGQTKDYKIGICCFSAKHASLRRKSKDWLARNQNNVSEWSDMSARGLLFSELAL